ncbi:O-antigen ligase family protein [Bdellovibrio bacteriovorus]|uniref:O-antigen ligase family protein n=1 Tax=Bdellovibrio bacteriovorus TaxID=959 RepID=UPI0035A5FC1C
MKEIVFKTRVTEIAWQALLALYCVSVFISKSAISIFGFFLILFSLFLINWKDLVRSHKEVLVLAGLYPLALLCSLFSLGGVESVIKTAHSWPWPLLALPAAVVFSRKSDHKLVLIASVIGLLLACGMSYYLFFKDFGGHFSSGVRVGSFWDISRWGLILSSSLMALFALVLYFEKQNNKKEFWFFLVVTLFAALSLLLSNTRAPWIAAAAGGMVMTLLFPRTLRFFAVVALLFSLSQDVRDRVLTIINVQRTSDGKITSTDASNEGRLHMWQVGSEFFWQQPWFGTGFENSEEYLLKFVDSKPGYREKYVTSQFSFSDQHSSYLATFVQMGAIFSCILFGVLTWLVFLHLTAYVQTRSLWAGSILALFTVHLVIFVFYTSIQSFEMVALFPFIGLVPKMLDSVESKITTVR